VRVSETQGSFTPADAVPCGGMRCRIRCERSCIVRGSFSLTFIFLITVSSMQHRFCRAKLSHSFVINLTFWCWLSW